MLEVGRGEWKNKGKFGGLLGTLKLHSPHGFLENTYGSLFWLLFYFCFYSYVIDVLH